MNLNKKYQKHLLELKSRYDKVKIKSPSLIKVLDEVEIFEQVYNSNAIENSTLTLDDTERVLLDLELSSNLTTREIYEAKNLGRIIEFFHNKKNVEKNTKQGLEINKDLFLFIHKMLLTGISDDIAGRFRQSGELVRVGAHIAPRPEMIEVLLSDLLYDYENKDIFFLDKIAHFHLEFETIHPFCDGNGRSGRCLINLQLQNLGYPSLIIYNKEKRKYYDTFKTYNNQNKKNNLTKILYLNLSESLHKRLAYYENKTIITLAEYSKSKYNQENSSLNNLINKAKKQTISAFREKGVWKIGV